MYKLHVVKNVDVRIVPQNINVCKLAMNNRSRDTRCQDGKAKHGGVRAGGTLTQTLPFAPSKTRSVSLGSGLNSVIPLLRRATFTLPNAKIIDH